MSRLTYYNITTNKQDHLYISDFDPKIICFKTKFNENQIYFPHNLLKMLML